MSTVAYHVESFVVKALPGFGFAIEQNNSSCGHLISKIKQFVTELAKFYDTEIDSQLARPECKKTRSDLVSWANSEICEIFLTALGTYRDRIWTREQMLPQKDKIGCEVALSYLIWLVELTELTKNERSKLYAIAPSSKKHQKKRNEHAWTPYPIPVSFSEIKRRLGL